MTPKATRSASFTGKLPRQSALKAANKGHIDIKLRQCGIKKVHVFEGQRVQVDKPKGDPAWMQKARIER